MPKAANHAPAMANSTPSPDDQYFRRTDRAIEDLQGLHSDRTDCPAPTHIGPYEILETLGQGGMGTVYLAEQRQPIRRQVAIKLIKLGMDSKQVLARFELERQALAMMEPRQRSPRCSTAGRHRSSGQPYFAMEYTSTGRLRSTSTATRTSCRSKDRLELFPGLRRRPTRPPEGCAPPRPETRQRPGLRKGR